MQLQQQDIKQNMFANKFLLKATVSPCTIPDNIMCSLMTDITQKSASVLH